MKLTCRCVFSLSLLLLFTCVFPAQGRPIEFSEISLLVRSHESAPVILDEVRGRKLLHPLTSAQENTLQAQGADASLIRSLRDADVVLSPAAAASFTEEEQRASRNRRPASGEPGESSGERVRVFDVAYGHPVDLSPWGGGGGEIAFQLHREAGEDIVEPVLLDSSTTVATYRGQGRPDDGTTVFDRRDYVSAISYERSRPLGIDTENPVSIKGVPYLLYPVSGTGGASLYYIGKCGGSVRLAVVAPKA